MALAAAAPAPLPSPPVMGPGQAPPLSPTLLNLNQRYNMSANSLTEALLLLSSVYISLVQPSPGPINIGFQAIFPKTSSQMKTWVERPFMGRQPPIYKDYGMVPQVFNITVSDSRSDYSPHELLNLLCDTMFPQNTVTVFYMNNNMAMQLYPPTARNYLPRIVESLGLPIISFDTQFSFQTRPKRSIQLAPTMSHTVDVLFAFLRRFQWHDFSFLCTLSYGCKEELSTILHKVEMSKTSTTSSKYGVDIYRYRMLSYVNFTDDASDDVIREKLKYEMDKDTRIVFVHGSHGAVMNISDVARTMGLTSKEYVWIYTIASIKEVKSISASIPIGSFLIGYQYKREYMETVIRSGINIWMDSLTRLATSKEFADIDFRTNFSCTRDGIPANVSNQPKSSLTWKYGEALYQKMLETKLDGMEFDKYGILKRTRFWIKNLQNVEVTKRPSTSRTRKPSLFGSGRRKPTRFGSTGRDRTSGGTGPPRGGSRSSTSRGSSSLFSRGRDPSSSRGRDGVRPGIRGRNQTGTTQLRGSSRTDKTSPLKRPTDASSGRRGGLSSPRDRDNNSVPRGRPSPARGSGLSFKRDRDSTSSRERGRGSGSPSSRNRERNSSLDRFRDRKSLSSPRDSDDKDEDQMKSPSLSTSDKQGSSTPSTPSDLDQSASRPPRSIDLNVHRHRNRHGNGGILRGKRVAETDEDDEEVGDGRLRQKRSASTYRHFEEIGTWDGHNLSMKAIVWPGGQPNPPKGKPEKYTLRVVTWQEEPHVTYMPLNNKTKEDDPPCDANSIPCKVYPRNDVLETIGNETIDMCCTGLCIDLLKMISERLHFDVELFEIQEGRYGAPQNDNLTEWNGMLGMVIHEEVDMAMAALAITPERSVAVEFSHPFLQTGIAIIVAIREGVISPTAFLEPYDYPSWMLILVFSVHATGASIFIFEWLSPYGLDQGKTPLSVHKFSLFRSFWLIWAMLFGASVSTDMPRGCASRFLANIWALFAVVFCASYTANLAAFMITKDEFYDLSGIQDWRLKNPNHRKPPFQFATINESSTELNIKNNYRLIYDNMKKFNMNKPDVKSGIKALKMQDIQAFIYDSTTLEYEVGKDPNCKLKTVGKRIAETGYGIAFPRKSQWLKPVDRVLLQMQEEGEIERLQKFWLAGACHKKKKTGVSSHTLGILNFTSAFILLGGGVILGVVLMAVEHAYFRFGRKSLRKWDKCGCCSLVSLSMGQSLTFERSVMEAIDFHRHHKCKDPMCETQLWKVKHELDLALLKIAQLRKQIAHTGSHDSSRDISRDGSVNFDGETMPDQNGSTTRRRRRQQAGDKSDSPASRPLLALEGKVDTDDDAADEAAAYPLVEMPLQKSRPAPAPRGTYANGQTKPIAEENKPMAFENPQYSFPQRSSREETGKRGSGTGNGKGPKSQVPGVSSNERRPRKPTSKVADLQLHTPPPPFEEALSTYPEHPDYKKRASPSPPLPPPPPTPPLRNLEHSGSRERNLPPPPDTTAQDKSYTDPSLHKAVTKRHEPVILDSPVSPLSSNGSNASNNPPSSPGGISQLSKDASGTSMASSPEHAPLPFVARPETSSSQTTPQLDSSSPNQKHLGPNNTRAIEADNDVNVIREKDRDGNVYVNVDDIVGKETSF